MQAQSASDQLQVKCTSFGDPRVAPEFRKHNVQYCIWQVNNC